MYNHMDLLIIRRITEAGFGSPLDLFVQNPGEPYGVLLRKIARPVPGAHHLDIPMLPFRLLHRRLHVRELGARSFAFDALTRSLREHLRSGWGSKPEYRARAFANWNSLEIECEALYTRIWQALVAMAPPKAWRPEPASDPLLARVFEQAWDRHEKGERHEKGDRPAY